MHAGLLTLDMVDLEVRHQGTCWFFVLRSIGKS